MKLSRPLVIIDLETTGTWVEKDKIVEVGMVKCAEDGKREKYVKRVNPGMRIPKNVSRIIDITNEDVKDAPYFKDIALEVLQFIGNNDLGGYNIERFDLPVLEREFIEAGLKFEWKDRVIYDAQRIYHFHEKRDLTAAYQFYCNKKLHNAHSALGDAEATLEILDAQIDKYVEDNGEIESLKKFVFGASGEYFDRERRFRWWNNELYPMFGKYAKRANINKIARTDRPYLEWILASNFSEEVKAMVEGVLAGRFPECPKDQ